MFGDTSTSAIAANAPDQHAEHDAAGVAALPVEREQHGGQVAGAATANASATRCATFWPLARIRS
jgi:hypothetical protein